MALNPMPIVVVGAMVDGKPNWTEVAHTGSPCGTPRPPPRGAGTPRDRGNR